MDASSRLFSHNSKFQKAREIILLQDQSGIMGKWLGHRGSSPVKTHRDDDAKASPNPVSSHPANKRSMRHTYHRQDRGSESNRKKVAITVIPRLPLGSSSGTARFRLAFTRDTERASRFLWTRLGSRRRSTEHWRPLSPRGHSPILGWAGESETRKKPRGREWKEWIAVPDRAFHLDAPLCSSFSPFSPLSLSLSSHWADARETRRASRWFRGLGVFLCFILFCSRLSTIVNYCNFVESREIFLRMYMYICVWFSSCQNFVPKYHTWYVLIMRKIWTR